MAHPNQALLRKALDLLLAGDLTTLVAECFDDEVVWHVPGRNLYSGEYEGKQGVVAFIGKMSELSGGTLQLQPIELLASDDYAAGYYLMRATRNDNTLEWNRFNLYRVRDGKIAEAWTHESDQYAVDTFWS